MTGFEHPHLPTHEASRTLKNSQAEFDRVNTEPFTERDLEGPRSIEEGVAIGVD